MYSLETDLKDTPWVRDKAIRSPQYAQNLYAALCNNTFIKVDVSDTAENLVNILEDKLQAWGCSWRYAGGIIAELVGHGDYLDWYCSGIRNIGYDEEINQIWDTRGYAPEGRITGEILLDLRSLGWKPIPGGDWENFLNS
jgi:hypothetical protein